jgi:hypothetical protein
VALKEAGDKRKVDVPNGAAAGQFDSSFVYPLARPPNSLLPSPYRPSAPLTRHHFAVLGWLWMNASHLTSLHRQAQFRAAGVAIPVSGIKSHNSTGIGEFCDLKLVVDWCVATGLQVRPFARDLRNDL